MKMTAEALEGARDARPTSELLRGLPHKALWDSLPDDQSDWWASDRNYQFYAAVASLVRPAAVLEVGVRYGYSLVSMLRGHPGIRWIAGVDTETDWKGSQSKAAENLAAAGYTGRLDLPVGDASWAARLPQDAAFGLAHVDGSHTREAVEADIRALWPRLEPGGVLVADDVDYAHPVRIAVEAVKRGLPDLAGEFYFPTFRGWWVAQKEGRPARKGTECASW